MFKVVILKNETGDDHLPWVASCERNGEVSFEVIDLTGHDWFETLNASDADCFLARPPGTIGHYKQLYDERLFVINKVLGKLIYPTYEECLVYENKRMMAYWLKAHGIPHPSTNIFYDSDAARSFSKSCTYPVVAKTAIGASGSGVKLLRSREQLETYINVAFGRGISRTWGPNLRKGHLLQRLLKRIAGPKKTISYFMKKRHAATVEPHKGYVLFQEYIACDYEWRCVRIGNSYFGHKKLRTRGELMSGTSSAGWDGPSVALLDLVKDVCDRSGFQSLAADIFEDQEGRFYVNEMQCFFGSKNPHQMILDGKPGRYVLNEGHWVFEEGDFNTNNSYDLRLDHVLNILKDRTVFSPQAAKQALHP